MSDPEAIEALMGQRLFFSVGEPSGDLHAASLIRSIQSIAPSNRFRGFGGSRMIQAGLDLDFDLTTLAVMGITEVLPRLREFFRVADLAEDCFRRGDVDGVVLVDFPGFNWHIAKRAKKYGLPVFYYLPPQLWAWGGWRAKKMRRTVDYTLCNLPFEKDWFDANGIQSTYVGHPFFDSIAHSTMDTKFIQRWRDNNRIQVAVLPGSRDHEVHRIWPLQLEVIRRLSRQYPDVEFMVAALKDSHALWCRSQLQAADTRLPMHIFAGKTSEIIELTDCALMKSGSVSLELMARNKPAVVMYHVSNATYVLGRMMIQVNSMTLPNLITGETIFPEFISYGSLRSRSAQRSINSATSEMSKLISDAEHRTAKRHRLQQLADQVAKPGASGMAAQFIVNKLNELGVSSQESRLVPRREPTPRKVA